MNLRLTDAQVKALLLVIDDYLDRVEDTSWRRDASSVDDLTKELHAIRCDLAFQS